MRSSRDFWAGLLYLALGLSVVVLGRQYAMGTSARMGPGYFPTVLGALLALLGLVSVVRAFLRDGESVAAFHWKPALLVLGGTLAFGLLLQRAGMIVALPVMIVIGALASRNTRLNATSVVSLVAMVAFCVLVFVKGLGLPMPLIGSWFGG